jgi:hypothetical protein
MVVPKTVVLDTEAGEPALLIATEGRNGIPKPVSKLKYQKYFDVVSCETTDYATPEPLAAVSDSFSFGALGPFGPWISAAGSSWASLAIAFTFVGRQQLTLARPGAERDGL